MRIDVVSIFPGMFHAIRDYGVVGRAIQRGCLQLGLHDPRDFTRDRHRTVDDRPYGGGPGMVMMAGPLQGAIAQARVAGPAGRPVIYLSPQGERLNQALLRELAAGEGLILLAGRYEGVDERLIELEVEREISLGDFVLSGGELAAMVLIDGLSRLLPGVLGHQDSAAQDSFAEGLLDHPHYTRPEDFAGRAVPEVLLSGNHRAIARWRLKQALGRTWERRPDLLEQLQLDEEQRELLDEYRRERQRRNN